MSASLLAQFESLNFAALNQLIADVERLGVEWEALVVGLYDAPGSEEFEDAVRRLARQAREARLAMIALGGYELPARRGG